MTGISFSVSTLALGIVLAVVAASAYRLITGRSPALQLEPDDGRMLPLALVFRFVAGPAIVLGTIADCAAAGRLDRMSFLWGASAVIWANLAGVLVSPLA
ncbi:MAG: hypothetical protein R3D33_14670 [Hyphomicrobiaceae bacterium]